MPSLTSPRRLRSAVLTCIHVVGRIAIPFTLATMMLAGFWVVLTTATAEASRKEEAQRPQSTGLGDNAFSVEWRSADNAVARAAAWGDFDNDGDLDLALGRADTNIGLKVFRNDATGLTQSEVWSSTLRNRSAYSRGVAVADFDNDGRLDIATIDYIPPDNRVVLYRNGTVGSSITFGIAWTASVTGDLTSLAWGDYTRDGWLDLAVGGMGQPAQVYQNMTGTFALTPTWLAAPTEIYSTTSLAWGDINGDGWLDLMAGNHGTSPQTGQPEVLYLNSAGILGITAAYTTASSDTTYEVAWGDYDRDGDPDLAVANVRNPPRLYRNDTNGNTIALAPQTWAPNVFADSVAWGDYDSDGDLDLLFAYENGIVYVFENQNGVFTTTPALEANIEGSYFDAEWGDQDNDGDLDIAVANYLGPALVLRNNLSSLPTVSSAPLRSAPLPGDGKSVAWADFNADGNLDLATGVMSQTNIPTATGSTVLYQNSGLSLTTTPVITLNNTEQASSIAWGDYDADGDLDLAVGADGLANQIYENTSGSFTPVFMFTTPLTDKTTSLAWGDFDQDGDLDLAVGNHNVLAGDRTPTVNRVYRNEGGAPVSFTQVWTNTSLARSYSGVAWGDVDNDSDLDLVIGNEGAPSQLFRNDNGRFATTPSWTSTESDSTYSIALGDFDSDGLLDLATANYYEAVKVYRNVEGVFTATPVWESATAGRPRRIAWGDVDNDGDLDLLLVNDGNRRQYVFRNDRGTLASSPGWTSAENFYGRDGAWGDIDRDGDLDLALATYDRNTFYRNARDRLNQPGSIPTVYVERPAVNADQYAVGQILSQPVIPITFSLSHPTGTPVREIQAFYSLNGGGSWITATMTGTLPTTFTTPGSYTFAWDVYASGFLGQSDNVVFRIRAIPAISNTVGGVPGPYVYGSYASQTFPFRVRGTQIRVLSDTQPISNAVVYRLPAGQALGAQPIADAARTAFRTNAQGFLQGRGPLSAGDSLVALVPITWTDSYTLYASSATPSATGLEAYTVTAGGIQTLTVSANNPLLVFNLDVSLEWDARNDRAYLEQLQFDLRRASEILFDAANGQVALGRLRVFSNRENWNTAHLRLYADNRLRPYAAIGGVVTTALTDPVPYLAPLLPTSAQANVYKPGQVHMPAVWSRYADPRRPQEGDWARTLAHELAHYLLFQDDAYLGFDSQFRIIPTEGCAFTLMADPYNPLNSEFRPGPPTDPSWLSDCGATLANQITGRADWQTIRQFYPALFAPANVTSTLSGPTNLPLELTQVEFVTSGSTPALQDPRFYLRWEGSAYTPGNRARAFLFTSGGLVDLGGPVIDSVLARGAQPNDRVCVLELDRQRQGCRAVLTLDNQVLALTAAEQWQPDIRLTPETTRTLRIEVLNLTTTAPISVQLYSDTGLVSPITGLIRAGEALSGSVNFTEPVLGGYVHVFSGTLDAEGRSAVAEFALGGNPVDKRSGGVDKRSGGVDKRSGGTPLLSGDGQVLLYTTNISFALGSFFSFQEATYLPDVPRWARVIGKGYRLLRSAESLDLSGASLNFGYAENDVPPGKEGSLQIHFCNPTAAGGCAWQALASTLDAADNSVTAAATQPGLYALLVNVGTVLNGPGWRTLEYGLADAQPVPVALASIAGSYSIVYHTVPTATEITWQVYAPEAPEYVNDLQQMAYGQFYAIHVLETVTWTLETAGDAVPAQLGNFPPMTLYGPLLAGEGFTPTLNSEVTAYLGELDCGRARVMLDGPQLVYVVKVWSAADRPGCGQLGSVIRLAVDARAEAALAVWDNRRANLLAIGAANRVYLPLIQR